MNRYISCLIVISILFSCVKKKVSNERIISTYKNGKPNRVAIYSISLKDSSTYLRRKYYESGNLFLEGGIENDKRSGKWIWYWENGNKKDEAFFKSGIYINKRTHWYEIGVLKEVEFISAKGCNEIDDANCSCVDSTIFYYPNGKVEEANEAKDGATNGTLLDYYSNGQKEFEGHYNIGIKEGNFFEWDSLGQMTSYEIYKKDTLYKKIK